MLFLTDNVVSEGLTFDDVLLIPSYSTVLLCEVGFSSEVSRNMRIKTPVVKPAIGTVNGPGTAIVITFEEGIGAIYKNICNYMPVTYESSNHSFC